MSGTCPDCAQPVDSPPCPYCGWNGDVKELRHKRLTPEMADDFELRLEQKKAGRLFVVVVDVEGVDDLPDQAMRLLGAHQSTGTGSRHRMTTTTRPTDEALSAVRALPGIKSVRLA